MGKILDVIIGNAQTLDEKDLQKLDRKKSAGGSEYNTSVSVGTIQSRSDISDVRKSVLDGNIVFAEVEGNPSRVSRSDVVTSLNKLTKDIGGDISWASNSKDYLILTPDGIDIDRDNITQ